jgi:GNAT superfamily N-acetyltransferase
MPDAGADPALVAAWLAARSISRGLPPPVPDHGGLRVDTGSASETRRYVFARPTPGLTELARTVRDPLAVLKLCSPPAQLQAALPVGWAAEQSGSLMACDHPMPQRQAPSGYRVSLQPEGSAFRCTIVTAAGDVAATGHAAETEGAFIFDRIVTEAPHRRRGLGAALVTALAEARRDPSSRFVLVATPAGRLLYETLGWSVISPYSTARLYADA